MSADDVARAIRRMAHEILERNHGADELMIIGMQTGGVDLARSIAAAVTEIEGSEVPTGTLDATMHRDDFGLRPVMPEASTEIPGDPTGKTIVLVGLPRSPVTRPARRSCWSTTCSSPAERSGPRSTPSTPTAARRRFSWL